MRTTKKTLTALVALAIAFTALMGAGPAAAASGFHAAFFSESDFINLAPGQSGQFAVGYANTGDQAWVKGGAGQQANLATAAPLDNTSLSAWNSGWLSANRYAAQGAALVAPGQIGFFTYTVKVPTTQPTGVVNFYGRPVIDGLTFLEDYGYYQAVNVSAGSVLITSSLPVSPNVNPRPTVNGTGAGVSCTVTVYEGTSALGGGTSDASTNFVIGLTTSLSNGAHVLTASATCPDGSFKASGNTFSYSVASGSSGGGAFTSSVSASNTRTLNLVYNLCVAPNSVGASNTAGTNDATNKTNYNLDGAGAGTGISTVTMTSSSTVTLFLTAAMANPSGHSLVVSGIAPCSGTIMTSPETLGFTVNDTAAPSLMAATATAPSAGTTTRVDVTWNEPISCGGSYSVDGITATVVGNVSATAAGQAQCRLTTQALSAGTGHTLAVASERDQGALNLQSPNPTSLGFTVATTPSLVISSAAPLAENKIRVNWNSTVNATGSYSCVTPNATNVPCSGAASSSASGVDVTLTNPFSVSNCSGGPTTCLITITVTAETGPGAAGTTLTESPPSQVTSATITKDTTAPAPVSAAQSGAGQTIWDVTWSEGVTAQNVCVTSTCPFRIKSGATIIASTVTGGEGGVQLTASDNVALDAKTRLTAASPLTFGTYTLDITAGAVNDLAGTPNASSAGTIGLNVVDSTAPTVAMALVDLCTAGNPCKVFRFTYSEVMPTSGGGSATDISHYALNGLAVVGIASIDITLKIVTVSLTSNAPAGPDQWSVTGVTDPAGNLITPNPTFAIFTRVP